MGDDFGSDVGRRDALVAAALAAGALSAYAATLTPGLGHPPGDGHELTVNAARLGVAHPSGYPLYLWLGFAAIHLLPFGDVARRVNLLSALCAAGAVAATYLVARRLSLARSAAAFAAVLLAAGTTFWSQAVVAEVYAAELLGVAVTLWLLLGWARADDDRRLAWTGVAAGACAGLHLSTLGFVPAYLLFVLLSAPALARAPRRLALPLIGVLLGLCQFVWLPLRGGVFDTYPNPQPISPATLWRYTLGAFSALRFAVPLLLLPAKLLAYTRTLSADLSPLGVGLGLAGMWVAVRRTPAAFWLLIVMYLTNLVLFVPFVVPDPDVFFLAGFLPWVLFAGFAVDALIRLPPLPRGAVGVVLVGLLLTLAADGFRANDRHHDSGVDDFNVAALTMLPDGAVVIPLPGVFNADLTYWHDVEGVRPDVTLLGRATPRPPSDPRPLYTTVAVEDARPTFAGRIGHAFGQLPANAWYVPVLLGEHSGLRLSRITDAPPAPFEEPPPPARLDRALAHATLVGATATPRPGSPRPRVRLESWWRIAWPERLIVTSRLDDIILEAHELGGGTLTRWAAERGMPPDATVHEDVDVVLPSWTARGEHTLALGVVTRGGGRIAIEWAEVGRVAVP